MGIGGPAGGVFAAADVHYLRPGGARAAVVVAADAAFSVVLAERTATVAQVMAYRPGAFFERDCRRCAPCWTLYAGWGC